ncbi:LysR family transcriptional regulator [Pacificispira sp.]|uniref:LysR family transcriptional regulator n=1 Tax=Pacificispira sp. TaxID=2888761 RepID=UPI003BA8E50D
MAGSSDLTIHQFRVFDTVVNCGSFTRAALTLDIPQPAISRIVSRLESEVGTRLLNRSNAGVSLTAAGERFHANAIGAVRHHDLALEEARASSGLLIGDVVIAAPDSVAGVLFAPLVQGMKARHQKVSLRTIAAQSIDIPAMVAAGSVDIGIIADTHVQPSGLRDPLFKEDLYLTGPKSAAVFQKRDVTVSEASALPLILNAMPGGLRTLIDEGFAETRSNPNVIIEIDANNALLELLIEGAGFSILPYSLVASSRSRDYLGAVRLIEPTLSRTLYLITPPGKPVRSVVGEAIRQLRHVTAQRAAYARWRHVDRE